MLHHVPEGVRNGIERMINRFDETNCDVPEGVREWLAGIDKTELMVWEKKHPEAILR